ncbi:MAG: inosine/xanthosine triphosphatase [Candidatus Aenigmarchaeota archaeon]|nr:inosine/xanthosine triphosphatase [Candidatus Aenigmarchaeota archaeon]
MKIIVGSKNNVKIDAVRETIERYDFLKGSVVEGNEVDSSVHKQPKTLEETVRGAINRAKEAFVDCNLSVGIEDGLMPVPETKTGMMNVCVCVIWDGKDTHIGLASGFEYPKEVTKMVMEEGMDIDEAYYKLGMTDKKRIGSHEGVIGQLTKGRFTRKDATKEAVMMALIHMENSHLF